MFEMEKIKPHCEFCSDVEKEELKNAHFCPNCGRELSDKPRRRGIGLYGEYNKFMEGQVRGIIAALSYSNELFPENGFLVSKDPKIERLSLIVYCTDANYAKMKTILKDRFPGLCRFDNDERKG